MRYLHTHKIKPGHILAHPVYGTDGQILISANTPMTQFLIQKLELLGYAGAYLFDKDETQHFLQFAIDEELRIKTAARLRNMDLETCIYQANEITNQVLRSSELASEVNRVSTYDLTTWTHSVDVCSYACRVGIACGFNDNQLKELSQAALFHDIGKCLVSLNILDKPGKLTDAEFTVMKNHPDYGHALLKQNTSLPETVTDAVRQHHENIDGSGYPDKRTADQINLYARIIHVVDVYEACTAQRPYKKPMEPMSAIQELLDGKNTRFDPFIVDVLRTVTIPYPVGRQVELSDGRLATVYENQRETLHRPVVKTQSGLLIDLKDTKDLTITKLMD